MSAYTVNISNRLENSPKFLKIGPGDENVFKIDDRKNTFLKIQEVLNNEGSMAGMDEAIKLAMGEEALEKINGMDLSIKAYENIFIGIMAAISSISFEEAEKRFRNSQ